jgi:kynureninase
VAQTTRFLARAAERGLNSKSPADSSRRGGTATLDVPHAQALVAALAEREILVDYRPDVGLRISPHYYNTDEELDTCLDAVCELLQGGGWQKFERRGTAY